MSVIVKICGLATQASLDAALDAGASMAGFVFYEKVRATSPWSSPEISAGARRAGRARF